MDPRVPMRMMPVSLEGIVSMYRCTVYQTTSLQLQLPAYRENCSVMSAYQGAIQPGDQRIQQHLRSVAWGLGERGEVVGIVGRREAGPV